MNKIKLFIGLLSVLSFIFVSNACSKTIKYVFVRYKKANVRKCPSVRCKIVAKAVKNEKLIVTGYKKRFYKIKGDDFEGWIYYRAVTKPIKKTYTDYKVSFEFNNINGNAKEKILKYKEYLNFDFYKKEVEIIFSYNPEFNVGRIFFKTDFNLTYYKKERDSAIKPNQIDLYPFLKFADVFKNFLNRMGFQYASLKEFLSKFKLNLILKKNDTDFIIIEFSKKGKLFRFQPYIFLKKEGFKIIRIVSDDKELVKKSYIFTLGVPTLYDGSKTVYSLLYEFFEIPY
jgi:hypothetical protein